MDSRMWIKILVGIMLLAWGGLRFVSMGASFGFSDLRAASEGVAEIEVHHALRVEMGFRAPFSAGDTVELKVPVRKVGQQPCVDFYLHSDYYNPGVRAARDAFDFTISAPGISTIHYEISENSTPRFFQLGPISEPLKLRFLLKATSSYTSESFQRASEVVIESVRSIDCDA